MSIETEAQSILANLALMPFESCYSLSRNFLDIPTCPGLYAVRHCDQGILYIGQTNNLRRRFRDGHKAFFWAFLEYCAPDEIAIATDQIQRGSFLSANDLEILMIQIAQSRHNTRIK